MNAVDRFAISFLVPKISIFKESQNHTTTTTATVKIVTSSGLHVDQSLKRLRKYLLESAETLQTKVAREIKSTLVKFYLSRQHSPFQVPFIQNNGCLFLRLNKSDF